MKDTKSRTNTILAMAGLCGLLAFPSIGFAENKAPMSIEAMALSAAATPEQHEALAAYFREKAADARKVVKTHRQMAARVNNKSKGYGAGMVRHCTALADAAENEATAYDALAALEDEEAKATAK